MHGQLHGLAAMIGMPGQAIASVLISKSLTRKHPWMDHKKIMLRAAHSTWISLLLMFASLALMMTVQGQFGPGAVIGWANRIVVIAYCGWIFITARLAYRFGSIQSGSSIQV